jgi:hypothetical protein
VSVEEAWIVPPEDPSAALMREQITKLESEVGRLSAVVERLAGILADTRQRQFELAVRMTQMHTPKPSPIIMPGDGR